MAEEIVVVGPVIEDEVIEPPKGVQYLIVLSGNVRDDIGLYVECGCGEFKVGPNKNLIYLGNQAFAHAKETGHILRPH